MSDEAPPKKRRFWQFHLSTAILLMFAVPVGAYIALRSNAWIPEAKALTEQEFEARFPGWLDEHARKHIKSPDGTRVFSTGTMDNCIYNVKNQRFEGRLFDFYIRDCDSETKFSLGLATDATPLHAARGFIDDNRCVMIFVSRAEKIQYLRVWTRRFPEFWWGQFYRPEVWVGGIFGILILWRIIHWMQENRSSASASSLADKPTLNKPP